MEWEIPGAVATHPSRRIQAGRQVLAQIAQHHLDLEAAAAEQDGLHASAYPWRRYAPGFEHRAPSNAHLAADEWRVVENESPLAARCAAPLDELDVLLFEQLSSEVERVGDSRRGADEGWARPVKGADAFQTADDICDLASKQPAIRVQLVDDDELEAREEPAPARVMRKDARVQHVGVGHHDVAGLANRCSASRGGVAVIRVDAHIDRESMLQRVQLRELVLGECLGRVNIKCAPLGVLEQALQNREVVAERLAAGGGRNHDQVPAVANSAVSVSLVAV